MKFGSKKALMAKLDRPAPIRAQFGFPTKFNLSATPFHHAHLSCSALKIRSIALRIIRLRED